MVALSTLLATGDCPVSPQHVHCDNMLTKMTRATSKLSSGVAAGRGLAPAGDFARDRLSLVRQRRGYLEINSNCCMQVD